MSSFLHFSGLEEDLLILLSVVNSEEVNSRQLSEKNVENCLDHKIWPVREAIIEQKLISTAVQVRLVEDKFKKSKKTPNYPYEDEQLYKLMTGLLSTGDKTKSNLRFVCDKILHAKKFSIFLPPGKMIIEGRHNKQQWIIELNLAEYAISGLCLISQYENDLDVSARDNAPIAFVVTQKDG